MSEIKDDFKICWKVLPDVSRSFALCIELLPRPVDSGVMISYLVFRAIDTIEDSSSVYELKEQYLKQFESILVRHAYDHEIVSRFKDDLISKIRHTYEHQLLKNVDSVLRCYFSFDPRVKEIIGKWAITMSGGMLKHQTATIRSFKDQDKYCSYAAGIVGCLLTDLFYVHKKIDENCYHKLYPLSQKFGLALQKVNIIRDVSYDIMLNRFYWPQSLLEKYQLTYNTLCLPENRAKALRLLSIMVKNVVKCLDSAVTYVKMLPRRQLKIRVFCLIPLFMAIHSLQKCIDNEDVFIRDRKVKISRGLVKQITIRSYLCGWSNYLITSWYKKVMAAPIPVSVEKKV